jgi:transcriptional regulator with XRE-family HTH domain
MTGPELRFIRTEMGMTQAELAKVVHHDAQSVGRWERNEFPIDQTAEALIRLLAIEKLELACGVPKVTHLDFSSGIPAGPCRLLRPQQAF